MEELAEGQESLSGVEKADTGHVLASREAPPPLPPLRPPTPLLQPLLASLSPAQLENHRGKGCWLWGARYVPFDS